jgi:hypothetical protein
MAIRAYFRASSDVVWLRATGWPMLVHVVAFFESRATARPDGTLSLNKVQQTAVASCSCVVYFIRHSPYNQTWGAGG